MKRLPAHLARLALAGGLLAVSTGVAAPPVSSSMTCPAAASSAPSSADGFDSPYFGHTGANNGSGIDFTGGWDGKLSQLQLEHDMGLRWTWLPVHWNLIEPTQPTGAPPAPISATAPVNDPWHSLDRFVRAARSLDLNVALQVVVGGNADGPPGWAGRRAETRAAPRYMDGSEPGANGQGLVPFVEKLAERFAPGGDLATADGWTDGYGVETWLMDNEPDSYRTNWDTVADDYAEFVVKSAAKVKAIDPDALIVSTETAEGNRDMHFTDAVLKAGTQQASAAYIANGIDYVAGPAIDVASFHSYELLGAIFGNAFLDGDDFAAQQLLKMHRNTAAKFAQYENQTGHEYTRRPLWHTEGGFGFIADDPQGKKHWAIQWLTLGVAAGIDKLTIMDAGPDEARAVRTMTCLLPDPRPLTEVTAAVGADPDDSFVFRADRNNDGGYTYVAWARPGLGNVFSPTVTLPVRGTDVRVVTWDGVVSSAPVVTHPVSGARTVTLTLPNLGVPFNPPLFVVDQAGA